LPTADTIAPMATNPAAEPLVFPIGHYMGPFYPTQGAPLKHHIVRIGWDTAHLPDDDHFGVWALAHGMRDRIGMTPWTRRVVERLAAEAEVAQPDRVVDTLLEQGALAEVTPGTDRALAFAHTYRMQSLMVGLGNTPDEPALNGIGLPGVPPVVQVPVREYELWQWGHLGASLWDACELLADVWQQGGATDPADIDPARRLDHTLDALRILVACNVAYLDLARTPAED
jgi:hypothetical protein